MNKGGTLSFFATDHLGSTHVVANGSGGLVSRQTYYPFGAPRPTDWNPLQTDYTFTGQKVDASVGLMYYGARYYDAALGRFIQPDTITQDRTNPQGLNRYSYTLNNPLKYVDQSGHCWGWASGMRSLPNYSTVCPSIDLALSIVQHPNATPQQKIGAGAYLVLEGGAHAVLAAGTAVVTWEGIAAAGAAGAVAETGTTVTGAACGDGDCTNEATALSNAARTVWQLDIGQRGRDIEAVLGRSNELTQNFPVIDRFKNGVVTSIKSIDLGAASYQNIDRLTSTVKGYVTTLAGWQGARWADVTINAVDITGRKLLLAIPPGATQEQLNALEALTKWATTIGVQLETTVVP